MTARMLTVEFGMIAPRGFSWAHSVSLSSRRVHLQRSDTDSPYAAACGAAINGAGVEFLSGDLCRKCADAAGVRSTADLDVSADEIEWSRSQS